MTFTMIQGTFHLLNTATAGGVQGFEPDGDSMQFKPNDPSLLDGLTQLQRPYRLTSIGSVQLRFEGIDALELHYAPSSGGHSSHQPRPLADSERDFLTATMQLDPVTYVQPRGLSVQSPAPNDGAPGYILSRSLEVHGRPVAFVFADAPPAADGTEVFLDPPLLAQSLNHRSIAAGCSYPLFYDTLFRDLRDSLAQAAQQARAAGLGLWAQDASLSGLTATGQTDLETNGVIFPKLFRRLTDHFGSGADLTTFLAMPELHTEQVQDLDPASPTFTNFTHFDSMISVAGNTVALTQAPETMLFISDK